MHSVLPGRPASTFHAVDTAIWAGRRIVVYITRNALIILNGPHELLQTITHGGDESLENSSLAAVAIDAATGKIVTSNGLELFIYRPVGQDIGALRWTLQEVYKPSQEDTALPTLSWGLADEVLHGGARLTLINTSNRLRQTWQSKSLANPVSHAAFAHDATLIASVGRHDRVVKIWRRGFIGGGNERFDPVYLGHPATVTSLRWRGRPRRTPDGEVQHADPVLYTTCVDGKLRVWTANDAHSLTVLQLWAEVDLNLAIQPRDPLSPTPWKKRYVLIIDQWEYKEALAGIGRSEKPNEREQHTREHLQDIASRDAEIAVVLDEHGNMSAWGLERVGCKARHGRDVVNIAHGQTLGLQLPEGTKDSHNHVQLESFAGHNVDGHLEILAHFFDGRLRWLRSRIDKMLDPLPLAEALTLNAELTGHVSRIDCLVTNEEQKLFLSYSADREVCIWTVSGINPRLIRRQGWCSVDNDIQDIALSPCGTFAVVLFKDKMQFIRTQAPHLTNVSMILSKSSSRVLGPILLGFWIPIVLPGLQQVELFKLQINGRGYGSFDRAKNVPIRDQTPHSANGIADDDFIDDGDADRQVVSFDWSQGQRTLTCDRKGRLTTYSYQNPKDSEGLLVWHMGRSLPDVSSHPAQIAMSWPSSNVAVISADRTTLQLWNMGTGHLEHVKQYARHETLLDIQWTSFSNGSVALAVVLAHKVDIWVPARLDRRKARISWICLEHLALNELTSDPIASVVWTSGEDVIVAAGSLIFVFDTLVHMPQAIEEITDLSVGIEKSQILSTVAAALDIDLAVYHPEVVGASLEAGLMDEVANLLEKLHQELKFYSDGDFLSSCLRQQEDSSQSESGKASVNGEPTRSDVDEASPAGETQPIFLPDTAEALSLKLADTRVPWISAEDRDDLTNIVKSFGQTWKLVDSVDKMGLQYIYQFFDNCEVKPQSSAHSSKSVWKQIFWASQSAIQDILMDFTAKQYAGQLTWQRARESGVLMWTSDLATLRLQLDTIGKNEYNSTDARNPIDCSLLYIALHKKSTLVGLWRLAHWHREQRATYKMLQNDFSDPRWKTAALKNAYALLGKRRIEYAAAFFVLGGDLKSAVAVLCDQLGDLQLAVAVARAHEGDDGPVLRELLEDRVLKIAVRDNNPWIAAWAFWLLGRKTNMLQAFLLPLKNLVADGEAPSAGLRTQHHDDPSLASAYQRVRDAMLADLRESKQALSMPVTAEHKLVMRCCMIYMRMGCGSLALHLIRTFTFSCPSATTNSLALRSPRALGGMETQPSILDDLEKPITGQSVVAEPANTNGSAAPKKRVAEEPSAASILDSFDF